MSDSYNLLGQQTENHPDSGLAQVQPSEAIELPTQSQVQTANKSTLYSSNKDSSTAKNLKDAGFDLLVNQDETAKSAVQIASSPDELIENIVRQTTDTSQDEKRILSELDQLDSSFELGLPATSSSLNSYKQAKVFFIVSVILALASFLLFSGAANRFLAFTNIDFISQSQNKLIQTQADKAVNNYLLASIALDELAIDISRFNYFLSTNNQAEAIRKRQSVIDGLDSIRTNLAEASSIILGNPQVESIVVLSLNDQRTNILEQSNSATSSDETNFLKLVSEIYFGAARLYTNETLRSVLANKDLTQLSDSELLALTEKVLFETSNNAISQVALVELSRTRWTEIFDELESVIVQFDPAFRIFQNNDNYIISLTGYTFNSSQGTVNVSGEVVTADSRTFTLIADLMDALEESELFSNLAYTTFSKSFLENGDSYRSSLNLTFNLESRDLFLNGV